MILKRSSKILIVALGVIIITIVIVKVIDDHEAPNNIAKLLNISPTPKSLRLLDCSSVWVPTDVVVICAIEIDPKDFPRLLEGYEFIQVQADGTNYSNIPDKVGKDFPVAYNYVAYPKNFKDGGQITIIADQDKRLAIIDYYEE
ncbi:MAG: hypothetical protein FP814_01395 [Desulfobacterium sp.]|nr:hypothetical protein [Desulfobacterium sp.]MBU3948995.1 hypothetical protein [Pseudomonadota bacterium]MBU4009276.1 hypothetical protein [Pseudomonadota bacterium]MBU4034970.1 hypothetical protein [Pseudomonadota bacterium]